MNIITPKKTAKMQLTSRIDRVMENLSRARRAKAFPLLGFYCLLKINLTEQQINCMDAIHIYQIRLVAFEDVLGGK
ncbi:MAG: hypothetical protein JSV05_00425 [Candidatus Bathyarchaeota archaeon]|nr:MAG: hypothetical protein JSV05_00425 [Candidatus Bathyarchaeota archaeon]